jgi:uncharacterized membrane protein YbhN (UPF0104 family)
MKKNRLNIVIRSIISLGLLLWLALSLEWREFAAVLTRIRLEWMLLAVGWVIISVIISVSKWQMVLRAQLISLSWWELWRAYWAGLFFNNFLPSSIGGDTLRILWVGKSVGDIPGATTSVFVERLLATVGLSITGLLASLFIAQPDRRVNLLFICLIGFCLVLLGLLMLSSGLFQRFANSHGRIVGFLRGVQVHGTHLKGKWQVILMVTLLSVAFQASVVGVNYSIFQALQITSIGWIEALYLIPVTSVVAMLPIGINGYGLREGAYVGLLSAYDVSAATAFTASLLFAFTVSLSSLYGAWIWLVRHPRGVIKDVSN